MNLSIVLTIEIDKAEAALEEINDSIIIYSKKKRKLEEKLAYLMEKRKKAKEFEDGKWMPSINEESQQPNKEV